MTSGAVVAVGLTIIYELTSPRRKRVEVSLSTDSLPEMQEFLQNFAATSNWNATSQNRLVLVAEETLNTLLDEHAGEEDVDQRRVSISARSGVRNIELEFVCSLEGENIQDQLSYLGEKPEVAEEREISFRLLRHYASSVRHHKYHGIDIVSVSVEPAR